MSDPTDHTTGVRVHRPEAESPTWFNEMVLVAFRSTIRRGRKPSDSAVAACAREIWFTKQSPWAEPLIHGALRDATCTVLHEVPSTIERLRLRPQSVTARKLIETYQTLLAAAEAVTAAGGGVAALRRVNANTNDDHRDQRAVYHEVRRTIEATGGLGFGMGDNSPAVKIAAAILQHLQINTNAAALGKMLRRWSEKLDTT